MGVVNLFIFMELTTNYLDLGYSVYVIYLDFQKVFDKFPHHRLLLRYMVLVAVY